MAKERKVKLLIGIPGSGKSTWVKEFLLKNPDWVKVGRDEFRFMMKNAPVLDFKLENLLTNVITETTRRLLLGGFNVIIDNTHCQLRYVNQTIDSLKDLADIDFRYFEMPVEECIKRDNAREKKVGEAVIRKMDKDLKNMLTEFSFQPVKKTERHRIDYSKAWKPELPNAVIFDIDGTLAHFGNKRGPFDWKKVELDSADAVLLRQFKMHKTAGDIVLVVSGRDGSCREETTRWLHKHDLQFDNLFMRPPGDFRKDSLIKEEIYFNDIENKYNIIVVYDDRDQVVETWRSLGLKCFQVEYGSF